MKKTQNFQKTPVTAFLKGLAALAAAMSLSCATPSRLVEAPGGGGPDAAGTGSESPSPPPQQKVWRHSIVRTFSPLWRAGAGDTMRESVFPILKDDGFTGPILVELQLEYFPWKAGGELVFAVEIEAFPIDPAPRRKSVTVVLGSTPPRKTAAIAAHWVTSAELDLPFRADAVIVRVSRNLARDTFSHDPEVTHLRLAY